MKKKYEIPNKIDFKSFLSKKVFNEPVENLFQFARGASSFNYLAKLKNKKILVKLAWKHKKTGVERLVQIINNLSKNNELPIAKIIPINKKNIFKYKNSYGFLLEYISGASIPAHKINQKHITQIINAYKVFQTKTIDKNLLIPVYNFEKILLTYQQTINHNIQNNKSLFYIFLQKKFFSELEKIKTTPLKINKEQHNIIHGDFHHNNMIFNDDKLVAFLDFEDIGYGYISEDLLRFILCLTARLPFYCNTKKIIKNYLQIITKEFDLSYDEWIVGLNSFTLQKMKKLFLKERKASFSYELKLINLLIFMKKHYFIAKTLKNLTN